MNGVSVALATYNGAIHLREQLESLAIQTMLPTELVVSDDGSDDNTLDLIEDFSLNAPFPVIIIPFKKNLGFADNFLHAAEHCSGAIIAFCDQDDVWLPEKLEICTNRLIKDKSIIALHTLTVTDKNLKPTGLYWAQGIALDHVFSPLELDPFETGFGNSMVFSREIINLIDRRKRPHQPFFPECPLSHDTWIYMLAAALGRVSHIANPLIFYRQHDKNASGALAHRGRFSDRFSVPLQRYEEQYNINLSMIVILEDISRKPSPFVEQALIAVDRFRHRVILSRARLDIYSANTFKKRYVAYKTYINYNPQFKENQYDLGIVSKVKAFCFGVLNIRRWLPDQGIRYDR